jgi:transcription initiation factor TFIIB
VIRTQDPIIICTICKRSDRVVTDPDSGEIICSNCAVVISDKSQDINRPERQSFSAEEANYRSRTGSPTSLAKHDMGLSTIIGRTDKDASGHQLDAVIRSKMVRLRIRDVRTQSRASTDRNFKQAFNELAIMRDKLGLSDAIVEKSAYIYRKAQERGFTRGRAITALLAASVYVACREMEITRTLREITAASNVKRRYLAKAYRLLIREFDYKVPVTDPMKCIVKVANNTDLSEKTKRRAMSIMKDIAKKEISFSTGKDPMSLAATILYLSSLHTDEKLKQEDIANAAGVTGATLRNRLKELRSQFQLD